MMMNFIKNLFIKSSSHTNNDTTSSDMMVKIQKASDFATDAVKNLQEREDCACEVESIMSNQPDIIKGMVDGSISEKAVIQYIEQITNATIKGIDLETDRRDILKRSEEI